MLLVYPDFLETRGGTAQHGSYSEGLASLAAVLKAAGHQVALYHLTRPVGEREYRAGLAGHDPDLVGFNARTSVMPYISDYVAWTRRCLDVPLIAGGYHPTLTPEETLTIPGLDAVCVGEGERPLLEVCSRLEAGREWSDVPGVWTRARHNPVGPLVEDLDLLPLPDFGLFDPSRLAAARMATALVMLSRGCPYSCGYCCNHGLRRVYPNPEHYTRFRSPERSLAYLDALRAAFPGVRYLNFMDDILPLRRAWFFDFIARYRREVGLPFSCRLRADLVDREVVAALRDAGCYLVHMGVETGDDRLRAQVLGRRISRDQLVRAFDACRELGLSTLAYNMLNLPGETMRHTLATVALNARLRPRRMVVSVFYPYPGTDLHRLAQERGWLASGGYGSEMPLRQPSYRPAEVWFMHRYFKSLVRVYQLLDALPGAWARRGRRALEAVLLARMLPRRPLTLLADGLIGCGLAGKQFLMRRLPRVYLWARDRLVGRAA